MRTWRRQTIAFFLPRGWVALLVLCAALFAAPAPAGAAGDTLEASVSQQEVTIGARITYSIKITTPGASPSLNDLKAEQMPAFDPILKPLSPKPSSSQQFSSVNGQVSGTLTLTWQMLAEKEGAARISAGKFLFRGRVYDTPAFVVKITAQPVAAAQVPGSVLGDALPAVTDYPEINKQLQGRLFARLIVSNTSPTLQEPVTATCVLYADNLADQIRGAEWEQPAWKDFFAEPVDQGSQLTVRAEQLGGRNFQAVTLGQVVLTPTRAGKLEIPASMAKCGLRVRGARRSFEDDFFGMGFESMFDNRVEARLPLAARSIDVQPLPEEGKPESFQNAVGNFSFAARVDRTQMSEDDLLTLTMEVGGQGYLGSIGQPKLPPLDGWKEAGAQSKTEAAGKVKSQGGKKIFEILLRAEKSGTLTIPAIAYAYYDTARKKYVEQTAGPFTIQVTKGVERPLLVTGGGSARGNAAPAFGAAKAEEPRFFGEQLAYIHTALPSFEPSEPPLYQRDWFWPVQLLPLLIVGAAAGWRGWRGWAASHADELKSRGAGGRARRELRDAGAALRHKDLDAFYLKLGEAVRGYLAVKFKRSASGLTLEEIARLCAGRGVDKGVVQELVGLLETCDQARYMSGAASGADAKALLGRAEALLKGLDKAGLEK